MRLFRKVDPPKGAAPIPYPKDVRRWSLDYLHQRLAGAGMQPYHRAVIESELRVREAWRSPASWSLAISILALLVSVIALAMSSYAN